MKKEVLNRTIAIVIFVAVIIITVTAIQLVGVCIDFLRKEFDLKPIENASPIATTTPKNTITTENVKKIIDEVEKTKQPSKYPDFDYYNELDKIVLASSTESWVNKEDNELKVDGRTYKKFLKMNGNITNAYLFVDVSVDNGKPLKIWDSIYVSLRKEINGYLYYPVEGHLLRSRSLEVPSSDITKLLYDLRQIPFTSIPYSNDNKFVNKDWLTLIQSANKFQFETFLSTIRKGGKINEISIAYECAKETPDCKLELLDE